METTFYIEANWNERDREEGFVGDSMHQEWELSDLDKLCFTCPLSDCKDSSAKCPINQAKKNGKKAK